MQINIKKFKQFLEQNVFFNDVLTIVQYYDLSDKDEFASWFEGNKEEYNLISSGSIITRSNNGFKFIFSPFIHLIICRFMAFITVLFCLNSQVFYFFVIELDSHN